MLSSWWLMWMAFMFFLFLTPIGYGWGYRGWGPPYPSYVQRLRGQQAVRAGGPGDHHYRWGWGGDFVWLILIIGVLWAFGSVAWWR